MLPVPSVAKGVNSETILLLNERVLYPDQRIIYVGKGQIISVDSVKHEVICITNYTLTLYHVHSSGHALPMDLRTVVRALMPKKMFPVHTSNPHHLKDFSQTC